MRKSAGTVNVRSMDAPTMAKLQETFPAKKANEPRRISVSPRTSAVDTAKLNRANSGKYATVARSSMFAPPTSEPRSSVPTSTALSLRPAGRLSDRVPPTEKTPKREPLVPAQTLSDPIKSSSPAGTSPVISGRPIRAARASSVDMFNGSGSSLPTSTANQYATVATDNPFLHLRKTAGGGQVREKVSWKQWVDVEESEDEDNMKDAEIVHEFRPHINHSISPSRRSSVPTSTTSVPSSERCTAPPSPSTCRHIYSRYPPRRVYFLPLWN
eukprot:590073_1